MLLNGINHVGTLTADTDRLCAFYRAVFDAVVEGEMREREGTRVTFLNVGPHTQLNIFEIEGNTEAQRHGPMFGRGRIDHFGLEAASIEAFDVIRDRLIERGASDGFVTDFGPSLSIFFRDPDGLEGEVCVDNPNAKPGVFNPPGTPAAGYGQPA